MSVLYAYVDESERSGRYLMGCVVVEAGDAGDLRRRTRRLLAPGQRQVHFKKESPRRRRELASAIVQLDLDATVYECRFTPGRSELQARRLCLAAIVSDVQARGEPVTLILESRHQQDEADHGVISSARVDVPALTYEHVVGSREPLLWLPDAFAWLVGAGGDWQRRVAGQVIRRSVG